MLSCLAALALVCVIMPEDIHLADNVIHTPQLSCILELEQDTSVDIVDTQTPPATEETEVNTASLADMQSSAPRLALQSVATYAVETTHAVDSIDTRVFLNAFYHALLSAPTEAVRVVHYGDSQIEEDRLTTQIRRALQKQYGGGGVGIIPLHQTIPTRTIWQSIQINGHDQQINQGPQRYLVYGPKSMHRDNSIYGPMGQVAIMDNNLVAGSEDIMMQVNGTGKSKKSESYFNRIRVLQFGDIHTTVNRATDRQGDVFILPDSTSSATIHLQGKGEIYGISLETDTGVMVDNIPMRGSSGAVFTSIAPNELQDYFQTTNTRLIILQFGGNIMPYTTTRQQVAQYIDQMQRQIQYIKYLAPESSIVFVGPSDMSERRDGQLQTYQMIPIIDDALHQMAVKEEIGYFSLYQHMGGQGSMIVWKEKGLAGGDYVHFTRKGADKAGEMLADWLMEQQ